MAAVPERKAQSRDGWLRVAVVVAGCGAQATAVECVAPIFKSVVESLEDRLLKVRAGLRPRNT